MKHPHHNYVSIIMLVLTTIDKLRDKEKSNDFDKGYRSPKA